MTFIFTSKTAKTAYNKTLRLKFKTGGVSMPKIDHHIRKSIERTGKEYREVHEWIDDPDNKVERHNINLVLVISKMFVEKYGEEAAQEYVQHLSDDLNAKFNHLVDDIKKMVAETLTYFGAAKS